MIHKKYLAVFKNSWLYSLEYRSNTVTRFLIAMIYLVSLFYLWNEIFTDRAVILGYDKKQIVTYYLMVGYLFSAIYTYIPVSYDIREGELSMYLTKPISYLWHMYFEALAKRVLRLIIGLPILIGIFAIFHEYLLLILDPKAYIFLLLTTFGAINILFIIDVLVGCIEFWITYGDSFDFIVRIIVQFFSGAFIPLVFLPDIIQKISLFLPFKYVGMFLIDSFIGKNSLMQIFYGILLQAVWTLILLIILKIVWNKGLKKYEAYGN